MTVARAVPRQRSLAVSLLLLCVSLGAPLQAQTPAGSEGLRDDVEGQYEVTPIRGGIGLLPKDRDRGISLIELRGDRVYLDGDGPFPPQRLAVELGPDAALILRLTYLDAATQRSVLGLPALTDAESAETAPSAEPTPPAEPAPPAEQTTPAEPERRVVRRQIIAFGGREHVTVDERVLRDVVVIFGSLVVDGEVGGNITVIGGSVEFGPEAIARRDVTIVGGKLTRDPGARFLRGVNEVSLDMIDLDFVDFGGLPRFRVPRLSSQVFGAWDLWGTLIRFAFFGLLGSVVLLVAAGSSERVTRRVALEPVKAGFVGFLAQLLFAPLLITGIILLVVTIIGIPFLVLLVPVVLVGALVVMVLGFTGVAQGVGQRLTGGTGHSRPSVFFVFWLGLLIVMTPTLFAEAFGLVGVGVMAVVLGIVGFVVEYVAWTAGVGAVILNRVGGEPAAVGGAPPSPIPEPTNEAPPTPDLPLTEPAPDSSDDAV